MELWNKFCILFSTNRKCLGGHETFSVCGKPNSFYLFATDEAEAYWSDHIEGETAAHMYTQFKQAEPEEFIRLIQGYRAEHIPR